MSNYRTDLEVYDTPPHCRRPEVGCSVFVGPTTGMSVKTLERPEVSGTSPAPLLLFVGPGGGGATIHLDSVDEVVRLRDLLDSYLEAARKAEA